MTDGDATKNRGGPPPELAAMLRAGAHGHLPTEAAVDLLVDHGTWPDRLYRAGHVETWAPSGGDAAMAAIDWPAVADRLTDRTGRGLVASGSEWSILAVALSLSGRHEIRLGELLPRLDATNTGLVATAVATACNSGVSLTVHRPRTSTTLDDLLAAAPPRDQDAGGGPQRRSRH